jgi:glutaredoxin
MAETKSSSVPQVIIDGEFIGGYEDLVEYYKEETT